MKRLAFAAACSDFKPSGAKALYTLTDGSNPWARLHV